MFRAQIGNYVVTFERVNFWIVARVETPGTPENWPELTFIEMKNGKVKLTCSGTDKKVTRQIHRYLKRYAPKRESL